MTETKSRTTYWLVVAMLAVLALAGGASREDSFAQTVVRVLLPLLLAGVLFSGRAAEWRSLRVPIALFAATALAALAMLIPLPPEWWTALPGRDLIEPAALVAGVPQPWRPVAMDPELGWNAFFALIPAGTMLVALVYLRPEERADLITPVLAIIAASAALGIAQVGGGGDGPLRWYAVTNPSAAVGLLANRNHHALLLALGLPFLLVWAFDLRAKRASARPSASRVAAIAATMNHGRVTIAAFAAFLFVVTLLLTGSRAGFVLLLLALAGSALGFRERLRAALAGTLGKWWPIAAGVGLAVFSVVLILLIYSPQFLLLERLAGLEVFEDMRAQAFPTIVSIAQQFFPVGTGFGGFEPVYRAQETDALLSHYYLNEAHNDYLQIIVEGGLVGAVLLMVGMAWIVWRLIGVFLFNGQSDRFLLWRRAGAIGLVLIVIASAVDYPVRTPLIMAMMMVSCSWMQLRSAD